MNPETMNKTLISISKWGKATGILFIIMGAITALSGAFFFLSVPCRAYCKLFPESFDAVS